MQTTADREPEICNCQALRQASRHVTQFYDRRLAASGLRTTQFSILARLARRGPLTVGALADELVIDRTTLGRTLRPLQRDGLLAIEAGRDDRRSRELHITAAGRRRLEVAQVAWTEAQAAFEASFGHERTVAMRALMRALTSSTFGTADA